MNPLRPSTVGTHEQWEAWNHATRQCGDELVTETLTLDDYPGTESGWDLLLAADERIRVLRAKKLPPPRLVEEVRTSVPKLFRGDPPAWLAESEPFDEAVAWASEWLSHKCRTGLVISGPVGVGKTGIATYVTRLCGDPYHAFYWPVRDLLARIKADFDSHGSTLANAKTKPLLVLDDIGTERPTDFNRDMLAELVETRFNAGLATVVTTNLHQRGGPGSLQEHLGPRAWSRLTESTRDLVVVGPDRRFVALKLGGQSHL